MLTAISVARLLLASLALASDVGSPLRFSPPAKAHAPADAVPYESAPADESYDTVLLQGDALPAGAALELQRLEAKGWSPWRPAAVRRFAGGRFWAKMAFKGAARGALRLRVTVSGKRIDERAVRSVEVFLRGEREADKGASQPRLAPRDSQAAPFPGLISRADWGAKPTREMPEAHFPVKLTQHHTDGRFSTDLEESKREVRFIQDFHQNGRGWSDIGYHYLVDGAGHVFEGRPAAQVGAHVKANNRGNVGVALLGNFEPPLPAAGTASPPATDQMTPAQFDALKRLGRWLKARYGIRFDEKRAYLGHRDYRDTRCPGDNVYKNLPMIRASFIEPAAMLNGLGERLAAFQVDAENREP